MVLVSIDVTAATGVVATLRTFFDDAMDEWTAVGNSTSRGLCTSTLAALSDPLVLISDLARDLETRVELAVAYNTGDGALATGVLSYTLPGNADSITAVKTQLGIEIAQGINDLSPYGESMNREDVQRFEHYTTLMEKYAEDPLVTNGMFTELGPDGIVNVPIMLKDFASTYETYLGAASDEDRFWDDDTPMSLQISDLQQQFMESFGTGLATSTNSAAFRNANPDFADDIVTAVTENSSGAGWGLSQILRRGDYDGTFLADVGGGLYDFEKDQDGAVWSPQAGGDVMNWQLGNEGSGPYYDPFVGLFEAMGRSPEGAADFFNPDNGGSEAQERSKYLIEERTWRADDFNALGEALDAAATAFHKPVDPGASAAVQAEQLARNEQGAWIASAAVHYLGERDEGRNDQRIGDAGKDSLGHLLASYIADVDRVADGQEGANDVGVHAPGSSAPWLVGLPVGADFSLDQLNAVLGEVLTDDTAMSQVADATAHWNAHRIDSAVQEWNDDPGQSARVSGSVQQSSQLMGYVLGSLERGSEAAGKSVDERNQQFVDLASDVVGLIPTGGTFTSFLADQALSAGTDSVASHLTGNEAAAGAESFDIQQRALTDLEIAMAVALADSPNLPASARVDLNGDTYPWFADGGLDEDVLADPDTRNQFIEWMGTGAAGDTIIDLVPDIGAMYETGLKRGQG